MRLIGISLYAPDAPKVPAPDQTIGLIAMLKGWILRLEGPIEVQEAHNSAIAVDGVGKVEIAGSETVQDERRRPCISSPRCLPIGSTAVPGWRLADEVQFDASTCDTALASGLRMSLLSAGRQQAGVAAGPSNCS
jgi:hypothetical protein